MMTFLGMLLIFVIGNTFVLLLIFPQVRPCADLPAILLQIFAHVLQALATTGDAPHDSHHIWNITSADAHKIQEEIGNGWNALFTSFNVIFMTGLDIELLDRALNPLLAKAVYVYYVLVVPVIMLNLLIALMGGEYQKVQEAEGRACNYPWVRRVLGI